MRSQAVQARNLPLDLTVWLNSIDGLGAPCEGAT